MSSDTAADAPQAARSTSRRFIWARSILALMLREMSTRFGRKPGGYIWIVLQPLGVIIILALAFSIMQRHPRLGTSFLLFKTTGFMILTEFKQISQLVGQGLSYSRPLLEYPGVAWIDAMLARFFLNALMGVLVTAILLTGIILYEGLNLVLDWPRIVLAMSLTLLLGFGVGCLNCVLFLRFDLWANLWGMLTAPLLLVSGVLILYEDTPRFAQDLLWYNPVMHLTGMMREGFYSTYTPTYISVPYVVACSLFPMALGLLLLRRFHRELLER